MFSMAGFAAWPIYLLDLQKEWLLTNSEAGWISGSFFLGYVIATPFLVGLTDIYDSRKLYFFSSVLGALGLILFSVFSNDFFSAFFLWSLVGAGFAGTYMPGLQILNARLDEKGKEKYVSVYTAFFGLGIAFSFFILGILKDYQFSWQNSFLFVGFIQILSGIPIILFSGPELEKRTSNKFDGFGKIFKSILLVTKNKNAMPYILGYGGHTYELFGFRSWTFACIVFLSYNFNVELSNIFIANFIAIIGFTGIFASIWGAQFCIGKNRAYVVSNMGLICFFISIITVLTFLINLWLALLFLFIYNIFIIMDSGSLTTGTVVNGSSVDRGSRLALHSIVGFFGGALGGPVVGLCLDIFGGENNMMGWIFGFICLGLGSLMSSVVLRRYFAKTNV
ncbi:MAG: MFS transporter [SAR116 cluster bacterium]|nr:MFS transporter [SAR116 cluster bacterium]